MMANEMDGLEEDAAMSEIDFLCQENKAFRGRLEELTKELADSEEKRVILPQEMYKLPSSVLLFVMSGTKSELTRTKLWWPAAYHGIRSIHISCGMVTCVCVGLMQSGTC